MSWEIDRSSLRAAARSLQVALWLLAPLFILMVLSLYLAFLYAPTERQMGAVQRIFYFHVASASNAFLAFFVVFLAGGAYLWTRRRIWDQLAAASAEIGVVFTTIVLITGSIWAKPAWNTWWSWGDPRLMTSLVLWFIYIAYLVLRSSLPEGDKKYKYCAVFGMIGFIDVPVVFFSIRFWRTIHPVVITSSGFEMEDRMFHALMTSIATFTLFFAVLLLLRFAMRVHSSTVEDLTEQALDEGARA